MARVHLLLVVLLSITFAGCELAGDIFQAGAWMGAIAVILVLALVGFFAAKIRG
jgi:uncharacterized membrane protein YkvI